MRDNVTSCTLARDILEWHVPEEVLAVLLKDRSTGRNLTWAMDAHAAHGRGFGASTTRRSGSTSCLWCTLRWPLVYASLAIGVSGCFAAEFLRFAAK